MSFPNRMVYFVRFLLRVEIWASRLEVFRQKVMWLLANLPEKDSEW